MPSRSLHWFRNWKYWPSVALTVACGLLLASSWVHLAPRSPQHAAVAAEGPPATPPAGGMSVRAAGAVGDGVADDTEAFRRALRHGSIYLPRGTYRLTDTLDIDLAATPLVSVQGESGARILMTAPGPALRFRGTHTGTADPSSVLPGVGHSQRFPTVSGCEITGTHAEADGLELLGTMQFTADRLLIYQVRHGIRLRERNRNLLLANCHLYDNRGIGIWYDHVNLHQSNISGCHVSYCRGGGIVVQGGDVRNIHITGCDIEGNMAPAGPSTANVLLDCDDGTVAEVAITGCTIQHDAKSPASANIRILGRGHVRRGNETLEFQCGHVTITGNVLSDVHYNLDLRGVRGATVTGNTLWQGYTANLWLEDCTQVVVGPNMLERNPLYGYTQEACNRVVVQHCRDLTFEGLHVHHVQDAVAGVVLENCDRLHVRGCTILDCDGAGLLVHNVTRSSLGSCLIRDDRSGERPRGIRLRVTGVNTETTWDGQPLVQDVP
ncbi:MAG: right-handed parallel beta-helix repeat-containing protein [Pirellulales bacterium]